MTPFALLIAGAALAATPATPLPKSLSFGARCTATEPALMGPCTQFQIQTLGRSGPGSLRFTTGSGRKIALLGEIATGGGQDPTLVLSLSEAFVSTPKGTVVEKRTAAAGVCTATFQSARGGSDYASITSLSCIGQSAIGQPLRIETIVVDPITERLD